VDVTVIITTWGSPDWMAQGTASLFRAVEVLVEGASVAHHHANRPASAGSARNEAVDRFDPEGWICFLDADDRLEPGYLQAMDRAQDHDRQLLTPALQIGRSPARHLTDRDILTGLNPCPIGTLIHRSLFDEIGGFGDEPAWEDFAMFQRAVLVGAEIKFVPDAVYLASYNPRGRNSTVHRPKQLLQQIRTDNRAWARARS
jgi:glycosyltransferase involved in cell wall biosynthesis